MPAKQKNGKVEWEKIEIVMVPMGEPNPQNPYAMLKPEERRKMVLEICGRVVGRGFQNKKNQDSLS
jgi:hypothetical protein